VQWKKLATLVIVVLVALVVSLSGIAWHRAHSPRTSLPMLIPGHSGVGNPR
jgi:hypothetical protein